MNTGSISNSRQAGYKPHYVGHWSFCMISQDWRPIFCADHHLFLVPHHMTGSGRSSAWITSCFKQPVLPSIAAWIGRGRRRRSARRRHQWRLFPATKCQQQTQQEEKNDLRDESHCRADLFGIRAVIPIISPPMGSSHLSAKACASPHVNAITTDLH